MAKFEKSQKFEKQFDKQVDTLKIPPHSIEAEQSVLGGLMLDNEAWDRVAERVVGKDFYTRTHKLIFEAMERLVDLHKPIDLITISETLEKSNQLEGIGGFAYLGEIAKNTPSAANISAYADIVRERAVVREMIGVANEIAEAGFNPEGRESHELLDLAESKVFKIAESRNKSTDGPQNIHTILEKTVDKITGIIMEAEENKQANSAKEGDGESAAGESEEAILEEVDKG